MPNQKWTIADMPDQKGKVAVVTGGNSGLGYYTVLGLAKKGADVILACRTVSKGDAARTAVVQQVPGAAVEVMTLDLADLNSIWAFAQAFKSRHPRLHMLINNAGVMALPRQETADGFEMQFGTNHLGHFALTLYLLDSLLATPGSRVVTVSSGLHRRGVLNLDDLMGEQSYDKWDAYSQSKLANLLFAFELQSRLEAIGNDTISVAAHPGYAATNLQQAGPQMEGSRWQALIMGLSNALFAQSAEIGALPQLYAATAVNVQGGEFIGPDGFMEMRGHPARVKASPAARDAADAARLWQISEELTGTRFEESVSF